MRPGAGSPPAAADREDFLAIFEWKTRGRGRSRPACNGDAEIADALDLAMAARTERAAVAVLTGLYGVDVPVASAVLTAAHPGRYTILDFRALYSLGVDRATYSRRPAETIFLSRFSARRGGVHAV